jgi:RNA polymerase sigma-70 factor (ECF subfamily)
MQTFPLVMTEPTNPAQLVARVRDGDADALSDLYARYGNTLMAVAFRLMGSAADAEDVLHDVFLGLPEALRGYHERGALEAWLKRVTTRVALTRLRSRGRAREVSFDDEDVPLPSHGNMERLTDLIAVQRAIDALPETLRLVFVLREVEGYSHAEIAELLEITTNASEVRLHRAIRSLRRTLGDEP